MAYLFSNICTENYWNRTTIVEIIVGDWVVSFFETQCINKKPTPKPVFSRMRRAATAESILIKFSTSTPWADVVIYLKRCRNWPKGLGEVGVRNFAYSFAFNTAYCAAANTPDSSRIGNGRSRILKRGRSRG